MSPDPDTPVSEMPSAQSAAVKWRFQPKLFFSVLMAPGLLSVATFLILERDEQYALGAFWVLFIGSLVAGLFCGIHFILSQSVSTTRARWGWGIVSVILCAAVSIIIGIGGCGVVNPRLF